MQFGGSLMENVLRVRCKKNGIVKVVWLAKFEDKWRPLMMKFSNAHFKNVVMENVTKFGWAKDRFKGITISHDMIAIKETEQCRELVEKAYTRKSKLRWETSFIELEAFPDK